MKQPRYYDARGEAEPTISDTLNDNLSERALSQEKNIGGAPARDAHPVWPWNAPESLTGERHEAKPERDGQWRQVASDRAMDQRATGEKPQHKLTLADKVENVNLRFRSREEFERRKGGRAINESSSRSMSRQPTNKSESLPIAFSVKCRADSMLLMTLSGERIAFGSKWWKHVNVAKGHYKRRGASMIIEFENRRPKIGHEVFVAPTAVIIGDVTIGEGSSIWFGAVLRGDEGAIIIGQNSNVQDNAVIHATLERSTLIGDNVTVGHGALMEGCTVESGAVIGMGAVLLEDVTIGKEAMVAAGSVVTSGTAVPPRTLAAGIPAVVKKEIAGGSLRAMEIGVPIYRKLARSYRDQKLGEPPSE